MPSTAKIVPRALHPSSTIAIISPSARLNDGLPNRITSAVDFLSSLGYKVQVIYTPLSKTATLKESVLHRVNEIHKAFADPEISAIICTLGGSTANELLRHLDYPLIKANPKIFCGFSDITILHYALYTHADLRTFYGPKVLTQWAEFPQPMEFTSSNFFQAVTITNKPLGLFPASDEYTAESAARHWFTPQDLTVPRPMRPNPGWRWIRKGKAEGIMFGGCLPTVLQLGGTPYDLPSYHNVVLLLELPEGESAPYSVGDAEVGICDLANRGVFSQIAGLILGRSPGYTEEMNNDWEGYVVQTVEGVGRKEGECPILSRADVGHTDPILTVPLGALAEMDSERGHWSCLEAGVV